MSYYNDELLNILEKKGSLRILVELLHRPGASKRDLVTTNNGGSDRTLFIRIGELTAAGLIDVDDDARQHNTMHLYLSRRGQKIAVLADQMLNTE